MGKIKAKLKDLFSLEKPIHERLLNALLFTGMICCVLATIISLIFQFEIKSIYLIIITFVACVISLCVANVWNKPVVSCCLICLFVNLIVFPLMYFVSGGLYSGCPVWMLMGLLITFALTPGTSLTVGMFLICAVGPIGTVIVGFNHPDWIIPLGTDLQVAVDVLNAVVLVALMFGAMYKIQASAYEKQKKDLEKAAKTAIDATKAKSNFLSNITHDIRTPMNSIIGFTEIARKNIDNRATLLESLSFISLSSEHLLALVNDVLEMSKIESGKFVLQCEPASITDIVTKVETIMTPEIEDMNLHFIVDTSEVFDDSITCDVSRVTQILMNLLSNAVKYSHPDGHIYMSVSQKQNPAEDNILCEIRVRDEGFGIGDDFIPHIFEPFAREKNTKISGIPGSGLGLPITKNMIEMMNGTISVASEPGKGSEFTIRIPFEMPTLLEIEQEDSEDKLIRFDGKRVLVVEDNDLNCEIVKELLTDVGFEVDAVKDGTYAIEKVRLATPGYYDIILMDIQMPLMSGYEATEIIRSFENERISNVPIIALTANAFDHDRDKADQCGMNDFIAKPINAREMILTIKSVLGM